MESAILAAIGSILTIIETVLPAISGTSAATSVIISIVGLLEKWVPIVVAEMPSAVNLFDSLKGAIAALSANPATPQEQLPALQQLDVKVDAAFDAAADAVDPDAPGASA